MVGSREGLRKEKAGKAKKGLKPRRAQRGRTQGRRMEWPSSQELVTNSRSLVPGRQALPSRGPSDPAGEAAECEV